MPRSETLAEMRSNQTVLTGDMIGRWADHVERIEGDVERLNFLMRRDVSLYRCSVNGVDQATVNVGKRHFDGDSEIEAIDKAMKAACPAAVAEKETSVNKPNASAQSLRAMAAIPLEPVALSRGSILELAAELERLEAEREKAMTIVRRLGSPNTRASEMIYLVLGALELVRELEPVAEAERTVKG